MEQERLKEEFLKRKKEFEKALIEVFGEEGYRLLVELYESGALRHLFVPASFASEWGIYVLEDGIKKLEGFSLERAGA